MLDNSDGAPLFGRERFPAHRRSKLPDTFKRPLSKRQLPRSHSRSGAVPSSALVRRLFQTNHGTASMRIQSFQIRKHLHQWRGFPDGCGIELDHAGTTLKLIDGQTGK